MQFNPNKILIFDLEGPMAHFRKYYTNSSSLSYLFPPRTVVVGLIAGLLGLPSEKHRRSEKETYYEQFSSEKCLIAVSLRTKIRRMMQTVNYIKTTSLSELDGSAGSTQIPLEILLPETDRELTYRIYFHHVDDNIYNELKWRLHKQKFAYPPYLGLTEFLASIKYIDEGSISKNQEQELEIKTICKLKEVEIDFSEEIQYITEKMPIGFLYDRTPLPPENYVAEVKGRNMKVKVVDNTNCYSVTYSSNGFAQNENIMFS